MGKTELPASTEGTVVKNPFLRHLDDCLDTPNILIRKNMDLSDYSCVLCNGNFEETLEHIVHCTFSQWC